MHESYLGQVLLVGLGGFVDTRQKIEAFMPVIDGAIVEGLATLEKVEIRFYRSGSSSPQPDKR